MKNYFQNLLVPGTESLSRLSALLLLWLSASLAIAPAAYANHTGVGNFPFVTLLCKYSDIADEPQSAEFVQRLFGDEYGGVNHYWKQASYGRSSLDGSQASGWFTMPYPRGYYFIAGEADVGQIINDCTAAADSSIDFSAFAGINIFTNGDWSGGSGGVGGNTFITLDGKSDFAYTVIGVNEWRNHGLVVHELGHGFGLRHSNASDEDDDPYDSPWSVMSSVNGFAVPHPEFGNLAKHFNAYEKELLGWLSRTEILELDLDTLSTGASQRVRLTGLGRANSAPGTYRSLKLLRPSNGTDFFFTLEAREQLGEYEAALPGSGVIIHEVDLQTRRAAWVVDADQPPADFASSAGVIWGVGEVYRGDGFEVEVLSRTATGFEVNVTGTNGRVDGNSVPFIRPVAANQQAAVDQPFQLYLFPVDPDGFNPELVSGNLPRGATLTDNENGLWLFRWIPTRSQSGEHSVSFTVTDAIDATLSASVSVNIDVIEAEDIIETPPVSIAPGRPEPVLGNIPWVTLLCKFPDVEAEPATVAFVQDMFGSSPGQINHWWKEVSYDRVNLDGSVVLGWYDLPQPREAYISGSDSDADIDDERLTRECIAAADADVDFSRFYGVNTFFNSGFNPFGVGFGEARNIVQDEAGVMATTAISAPAWTSHTGVIHEMSLAMGLPLANNSDRDGNTYDNPWTNMSDGQGYAVPDLRYELLAKHLNAFEKYSLGWLAASEVTELRVDATIPGGLFTRLAPMTNADAGSSRRAIILRDPILGPDVFYTLEARERIGKYDGNLPGTAVIAYQVDLRRPEPAWSLYDNSDGSPPRTYAYSSNDMWTVGETIEIPGASIRITGRTRDGFNLHILTGLERDVTNTTAGQGLAQGEAPVQQPDTVESLQDFHLRGEVPWANILCQFADEEEVFPGADFVEQMFGSAPGLLGHYWDAVSDSNIDVSGSEALGWYRLSGDREDYISETVISEALLDECIALADADVDFAGFYGVNLFFNAEFNTLASGFGGRRVIDADNAGTLAFTALGAPTWQWQAAVAHEMARAMGLMLTDNSDGDDNPYDNPWTLMSDSRAYATVDPLFNYRAKFLNAHDLELMGWLDDESVFTLDRTLLNNRTTLAIDLDLLHGEVAASNRLIRFEGTQAHTQYYVEARAREGLYDGSLPGTGVLIHELNSENSREARLYHDESLGEASDYADSPADLLTVGETVEVDGVEITVTERTETGFVLVFYSPDNFDPDFPRGTAVDGADSQEPGQNTIIEPPSVVTTTVPNNNGLNSGTDTLANASTGTGSSGGGGYTFFLLWLLGLLLALRRLTSVPASAKPRYHRIPF